MKRFVSILLSVLTVCALAFAAACAAKPVGTDDPVKTNEGSYKGESTVTGTMQTAGNITVLVPEGWVLIPGTAGGVEDDNSLFLKASEDAREYIWVTINTRANIDSSLKVNTSAEIAPFKVNGVEWQGKENAVYAPIGDVIFFVMTYGYTASDAEMQAVLGSLAKAN